MTSREMIKREENVPERVQQRQRVTPPVDILENHDEILLKADVPGAEKDGVNVRFEKNQLSFEAFCPDLDKKASDTTTGLGFDYARSFTVPGGVDAERISAELSNGVLTIHLPKQEQLKPRQIAVKAG